ncbi:MAG: hypothetical protein RBR41_03285 [Desulfovibrio sp.]|uniref:hypothetical protein n=1 Tax=Desulfovibrio sp. TaxID=885 RepID=UPI002A36586B|nr:hypothetical protein [Desulfovibrio sp.]MDY0258675.1 hypothetical protein [Desulfovibrio sp.]
MNSPNTNPRARLTFSTATLPGLIQAYAESGQILFAFQPRPESLKAALENSDTHDQALEFLGLGAKALSALEALEDGDTDHVKMQLDNLVRKLFTLAECNRPTVNKAIIEAGASYE